MTIPATLPREFALHTRHATTGANVATNAHPFTVSGARGQVVGIHNGIISNHSQLNARYARKCDVDSQHIFQSIADGHSLNELEGYGTIVYTLADTWYIGRFNGGELSMVLTDVGIFYASTDAALIEAASFAGIKIVRWLKVADDTVYTLTPKGIKKVYKVRASETWLRWDDEVEDDFASAVTKVGHKGTTESCELCNEPADKLYECDTQIICAECYWNLESQLPAGYDDLADVYEGFSGSRYQ
jgi:hypothetical protein